jgi:hypothetical protein
MPSRCSFKLMWLLSSRTRHSRWSSSISRSRCITEVRSSSVVETTLSSCSCQLVLMCSSRAIKLMLISHSNLSATHRSHTRFCRSIRCKRRSYVSLESCISTARTHCCTVVPSPSYTPVPHSNTPLPMMFSSGPKACLSGWCRSESSETPLTQLLLYSCHFPFQHLPLRSVLVLSGCLLFLWLPCLSVQVLPFWPLYSEKFRCSSVCR